MRFYFSYTNEGFDSKIKDDVLDYLDRMQIDVMEDDEQYRDINEKDIVRDQTLIDSYYKDFKRKLLKSHALVIDVSDNSFIDGYKVAVALLNKTPVLCLSGKSGIFEYIDDPNFAHFVYKGNREFRGQLEKFLRKVKNKYLSVRYNGFISPEQKKFLEWYGGQRNMNISEVIRDFINEKMDENEDFLDQTTI